MRVDLEEQRRQRAAKLIKNNLVPRSKMGAKVVIEKLIVVAPAGGSIEFLTAIRQVLKEHG